jgi:hypothetical protein
MIEVAMSSSSPSTGHTEPELDAFAFAVAFFLTQPGYGKRCLGSVATVFVHWGVCGLKRGSGNEGSWRLNVMPASDVPALRDDLSERVLA